MLVLGVQESGSVINILCWIFFHCSLLRDIEYSPLPLYFSLDLCMNLKLLKEVFSKKIQQIIYYIYKLYIDFWAFIFIY